MRTNVHATLVFGLVNLPVGVCSTTSDKQIKFKTLHATCGQPISQTKTCKTCEVEATETTKGFEFAKNQFIAIDSEELEQFAVPRSGVIEITKFVPSDTKGIVSVKDYWLQPNAVLARQYETLSKSMWNRKVTGIGKASLWGKEHPVAITAFEDGPMMLRVLLCADEMVEPKDILDMMGTGINDQELEFAEMYVEAKTGELTIEDLSSDSRERMNEYVTAKAAGQEIVMPEPTEAVQVTADDMFARLRESVELAKANV